MGDGCVLMFSGGRDSSIAAARLSQSGVVPTLVTITSNHLLGIARVRSRLVELKSILPPTTQWRTVVQPADLFTDTSFYEQTCLPCHHAYVVVAAAVARSIGTSRLAFGYTHYQSNWPEQTPLAKDRLSTLLAEYGIVLEFPVEDLSSREAAEDELRVLGLSPSSLEQKCSRQVTNVTLNEHSLRAQISLWEEAIRRSMRGLDQIPMAVGENTTLSEINGLDP